MALDPLRLAEHAHGHLAWLAVAALVHPSVVLRDRKRRAHLAVASSTVLVTVVAGLGVWLYVAYREKLRQGIFLHAPAIGFLFERKEHLAFGAVLFAWTGAIAYVAALRAAPEVRDLLRVIAFRAFVAATSLAVIVAVLGTTVAVYRSF